ncbi:MAG: acetate--CoA ligase family protein, partial [Cyanobium sp.]
MLASWMGGAEVDEGERLLNEAGIATNRYPDRAAALFEALWRYGDNLRALYETPSLLPESEDGPPPNRERVTGILTAAAEAGRELLNEAEAKEVLAAYGVPVVETRFARTAAEAVAAAEAIGWPVVVKLLSSSLTHKTEVGGVQLNLRDGDAVTAAFEELALRIRRDHGEAAFGGVTVQPMLDLEEAYELSVGSSVDPQFGPVLLFGAGGQLVEVHRDTAVALPPLKTTLARRLMERTRIHRALLGVRGRAAVDMAELDKLLVRVAQLVLDARIRLLASEGAICPAPRPAIRPYPRQYVQPWTLRDGSPVTIRPIRPEDEPLIVAFHRILSEQSVYLRYFHLITLNSRTTHERLTRICFTDYDREMALVVDRRDPA